MSALRLRILIVVEAWDPDLAVSSGLKPDSSAFLGIVKAYLKKNNIVETNVVEFGSLILGSGSLKAFKSDSDAPIEKG